MAVYSERLSAADREKATDSANERAGSVAHQAELLYVRRQRSCALTKTS